MLDDRGGLLTGETITDEQIRDYRENGPRTAHAWRACGWALGNMPGYREQGRKLVADMINARNARAAELDRAMESP